jgi:hypothetical protein
VGWFQRARAWLNNLGSSGGKRIEYRTHTEDGQAILLEASETVIGNNEATAFFRELCGGSLKEAMLRQGLTNVPLPDGAGDDAPAADPGAGGAARQQQALALFRKHGIRVSTDGEVVIFARPGTYPHVDLGSEGEGELPEGGRPLVIESLAAEKARPSHATVVFTVLDARRRSRQKQVTIHFHGRGVIRAKGFARELGVASRPMPYDGEEVRRLLDAKARSWGRKVHWCTPLERY